MTSNIKAAVLFIAAVFTISCTSGTSSNSAAVGQNGEKQIYRSTGVIKSLDVDAGNVTIDHEDIPGYMQAMEMSVRVGDISLFETLKPGDKVDFELERTGSNLVVTKMTKIGEIVLLNGSEIYKTNCAECHGGSGEGAEKGIPLISGHALHHSEKEHIAQVMNGEGDEMPAFLDKLTEEQIAEVVRFVRYEIQKGAARDDSKKHKH